MMAEQPHVVSTDAADVPRLLAVLPEISPHTHPDLWKSDRPSERVLPCARCQRPLAWEADERAASACPTCGDRRHAVSRLSFELNRRRIDFREFRSIYLLVTVAWFFLLALAAPWFWPGVKDVLDPKVFDAVALILRWAPWPLGALTLVLLIRSLWIFRWIGLLWFFFKLLVLSLIPVALMGLTYLCVVIGVYYTTEHLQPYLWAVLLFFGSLVLMKICSFIAGRLHRGLFYHLMMRRLRHAERAASAAG